MPTALIIGASRGIGHELARQYRADGWRVIATARKPHDCEELRQLGAEAHQLDVLDAESIAALVIMRESTAKKLGCTPLARIVGHTRHSQEPNEFTTAPVGAIAKLYQKTGWNTAEVDLFEVNEAFAAVAMAAMNEHKIPHEKINIHGGACALGHPIGASGARIIVTLLGALKKTGGKRGVASLCIGGGEATAMAIEMV